MLDGLDAVGDANTVVLIDGAQQLCETLAGIGEVGITRVADSIPVG